MYFNSRHRKAAQKHLEAMKKGRLVNVPSPASEIPDRLSEVSSRVSEGLDDTEEIDQLDNSSVINGKLTTDCPSSLNCCATLISP